MLDRIEQFKQSFKPRKAEENDTRQDIQRHDPEFHKKKKDDGEHGFKDPYEDLTDVSVVALITFLEGLLNKKNAKQDSHTPQYEDISQEYRPPVDKQHAQAMNAYQSRSSNTSKHPIKSIEATDNAPTTAIDKAAASIEDTTIKSTIRDLQNLLSRNIDHIALERGDGFIESIQNAIARY
jgi:hypothetical protein